MNITRILSLLSIVLLLPACALMNGPADSRSQLARQQADDKATLLGFIATGKAGEKQTVYDRDNNNEEGTAVIKQSYLAASGNSCRAYYWLPSGVADKAGAHNLNVACRAATGQWYKVRTLSNIETFLEKEPVGYVLH